MRVYRDEIETLKVQSSRVEKLEADVMKYRQKAEDTEYLKKRIAVSESYACEEVTSMEEWMHVCCVLVLRVCV